MKDGTSFLYPANQLSPKVETDTSLEIIWQSLWSIMKSFSVTAGEGLKKKQQNHKKPNTYGKIFFQRPDRLYVCQKAQMQVFSKPMQALGHRCSSLF